MIYQTLDKAEFVQQLLGDRYANWTGEHAELIWNYLNEFDTDIEFDAVAIRCDFSVIDDDDLRDMTDADDDDIQTAANRLRDRGQYLGAVENGHLIVA